MNRHDLRVGAVDEAGERAFLYDVCWRSTPKEEQTPHQNAAKANA